MKRRLASAGLLVAVILSLTMTVSAEHGDADMEIYHYYSRVNKPSAPLAYIHNDYRHVYKTESGLKPTFEEAQEWWKTEVANTAVIEELETEKQKTEGISYESVCRLMCKTCGTEEITETLLKSLEDEETYAYEKCGMLLTDKGYIVTNIEGKVLSINENDWYEDYDSGRIDKKDNMTGYVHAFDHVYRTENGNKPEYDEAMAWWKSEIASNKELASQYTDRQLNGDGMYEYICKLMCASCVQTDEEREQFYSEAAQGTDPVYESIGAQLGEVRAERIDRFKQEADSLGFKVFDKESSWTTDYQAEAKYAMQILIGNMALAAVCIEVIAATMIGVYVFIKKKK